MGCGSSTPQGHHHHRAPTNKLEDENKSSDKIKPTENNIHNDDKETDTNYNKKDSDESGSLANNDKIENNDKDNKQNGDYTINENNNCIDDDDEYYGYDNKSRLSSSQRKTPVSNDNHNEYPRTEDTSQPSEPTIPPPNDPDLPPEHPPSEPASSKPITPTPLSRELTPQPTGVTPQPEESKENVSNEPDHPKKESVLFEDPGEDDTPFDDDGVKDSNGYTVNMMGLQEKIIDFRHHHVQDEDDIRPTVEPGQLYVDHDFPLEIAIVEDNDGIEWKRPKEFLDEPKLFTESTTRFDIGQGSAGTCWFLSTVASIAENEAMVKQIIPEGSYKIEDDSQYDGIFHARFYRFGKWEDVYIDDYLPVIYGNVLWGAKSATDPNELWVALLEKAFARLYGSYDAVYSGQPGDAYLLLTGGVGERIDLEKLANTPKAIFQRIKNAFDARCQITCVVPDNYDDHHGLVGGHAYSLVGTTEVNGTKLIKVRNPWGHGEWTGPWSDGSSEWSSIADAKVTPPVKDNGEFYVCLDDFLTYFSQTTICSLTPDFDSDGIPDSLNHILNLYGEWAGSSAAGFQKLLQNPRFCFTVPDKDVMEDGYLPLVVQLVQKSEKRRTDNISVRCDVFRVLGDKISPTERCIAVEMQEFNNNVYTPELQSSYRHKFKPGSYMVIPSTIEGGMEKAFLLRLFTSVPLQNARQIGEEVSLVSCESEVSIEASGKMYNMTFEKTLFGAFVSDKNAGGQVAHRDSYHLNPQYLITIPDTGEDVPLVVHIMQYFKEPQYPVGFRLFKMNDQVNLPADITYLYNQYQDSPADLQGSQAKFVISWDVDTRYMLPAGRYIGLVHLDEPNTEKGYAIVFKSTTHIPIKGYQTC